MRKLYLSTRSRVAVLLSLSLILVFFAQTVFAQSAANYSYSTSTTGSLVLDKDGNAIDMNTGTTQLYGASIDGYTAVVQNIGFEYFFMGTRYSQFSVNPDGQLRFGSTAISAHSQSAAASTPYIIVNNTDGITSATGKVVYKVQTGTSGKVLIIEWNNILLQYNGATSPTSTFQLRLYENSGVIEMVYGAMNNNSTSAQNSVIGFSSSNTVNSIGQLITINTTPTYNTSTASYTNTSYTASAPVTNLNSAADGSRRVFTFTPTVPAAPTNFTISGVAAGGMTLNWQDNSANELGFAIYRSTDNTNFSYIGTVGAGIQTSAQTGLLPATTYYWRVYAYTEGGLSSFVSNTQATNAGTISGTKTVGGAGADYATLTAAFNDINTNGLSANVTLILQSGYLSSNEPAFPVNTSGVVVGTNTVTIYPAVTGLSITSSNATGTLNFNSGQNIIIDGRVGGTGSTPDLVIENANAGTSYAVQFINDANGNTIKYCNIKSRNTSTTSATIVFAGGVTTGNDNNTISDNNISDGSSNPFNAIYSAGTSASVDNSGNTVSNNNIYNYFAVGSATHGIFISSNSSAWTITGNSLYQTTSRTYTTGATHYGIRVDNTSGNGFTVSNNFVGGSAPSAGGTAYTMGGTVATLFRGIFVNVGSSAATSVQGNTIANISLTSSSTTTTLPGVFSGIHIGAGLVNVGTVEINVIGASTGTGSITLVSTSTGGVLTGIYGTSAAALTIQNNIIGSIRNNNTAANGNVFYGIYVAGSGSHVVSGNTVGSTTQANSISNGIGGTTTATSTLYGIYSTATSSTLTLNSNIVRNLTVSTTGTSTLGGVFSSGSATNLTMNSNTVSDLRINGGGGTMYGLAAGTSIYTVNNNTVSNLSIINSGSATSSMYGFYDNSSPTSETLTNNQFNTFSISGASTSTGHILYGIYSNTTTGSKTWSGNTVNGLSFTNSSTGVASVFGIGSLLSSPNIFRNKVYDLSAQGVTSLVTGILISSGNTVRVYNNLVGDLRAPNGNNTTIDVIRGISITSTTANSTVGVYYNTVYINATGGAAFTTSGIYHVVSTTSTTASLDLRNNNIINTSTPGTGLTIAYRRSAGAASNLANYAATSNNNNFFAGTPGANNLIYYDGTGSAQTISAYKAGSFTAGSISPRDALSVSVNAPFLSTVGSSPNFLHIDPAVASPIEKGGAQVVGITDDYDGDVRNVNLPDIGADEGNFTLLDNNAPSITYSALTFSCSPGSRTLAGVTITDASGVPTTGGLMPRVYFKKGVAGAWASTAGTLTSGDGFAGTWSFNIDATLVGGIVAGDVIYYYVIAQDQNGTPNISSNPSGITATDVNTVTVHPATPNNYNNALTLASTSTVGAGGTYPTLTAAVAAYNTGCLPGPVVFNLTDASYSTNETFPIVINANPQASVTNTLTIKPATGVTATISGNVGTGGILKLDGADYIIIDGSNNGSTSRNLTIRNATTTTSGNTVVWLSSAALGNGATNNTVKNTIIEGDAASTTFSGVFMGSSTTITTTAAGTENNNNNTFNNNLFRKTQYGLIFFGYAAANPDNNNAITNNNFGTAVTGEGFLLEGIRADRQNNLVVSGNEVQNVRGASGTNMYGIRLLDFKNGRAFNNNIHDVVYNGTSTTKNYGMAVQSSTYTTVGNPSNAQIYNNIIYSINSTGTSATWNVTGLLASVGYGDKYYYNTVHLNGQINNSTSGLSAAFGNGDGNSNGACTNADIRNNIFVLSGTSAGGNVWAYYTTLTSNSGTVSNYNLIRCAGTGATNNTGRFNSVNYTTLATWKTGFGLDANSIEADPTFNNATNLVPLPGSPALGAAIPIATYTTDILGAARSATTPTIGAYETARDAAAPAITFTPLTLTCLTSNRTVTATLTDLAGVAGAGNSPRIYFRKNAGAWFSTAGTLSSGTATNGTWDFQIDNALMGGVAGGDVISYYIIAQDVSSPVNITSSPLGVTATDVNTVTVHPAAPLTYNVGGTLSGAYTVGTGGNYTTLTAAVAAYNSNCLAGPVTFNLTDASYSAGETFPLVINANADASAVNTLTIKPATGVSATVSGSSASSIITLNAAKYIIIDGSNNGTSNRNLTIANTNASGTAAILLASAGTGNGAANDTIKNVIITTATGTTTTTSYGISIGGATAGTSGADNDNVAVINNAISGGSVGVYASGSAAVTAGGLNNLLITGNVITENSGSSNTLGIQVGNALNSTISQNTLDITTSGTNPVGISLETGFNNSLVTRNMISRVLTTNTGGWGGRGITIGTGSATSAVTVSNNVIYGVNGSNYTGFTNSSSMGIAVGVLGTSTTFGTTTGGINIYHNSVNMYGDYSYAGACLTAALYVGTATSALDIRNNVFVNSLNNTNASGTGSKNYAFYSAIANTAFASINYNDYFVSGTQGVLGFLTADQATISALRTATAQDVNSISADPQFNINTILVPKTGSALIAAGTPIVAVTVDYKGTARSVTTPSIGAYEAAGDGAPPVIAVNSLSYGCTTGNQTLSATITDETGIPTTGSLVPRVYYKKNAGGAWFSQPGTLSSGTATNSTWNFTIVAADMGGLLTTDVINYYVVAQDIVASPNVGASSAGVVATDVNTVSVHPVTTLSMTLNGSNMSGNYNVGGGGAYTTLTAAVAAYNLGCLTGAVTFTLTDAGYNSGETFPIVINSNAYATSTNTLTIRPAANTAVSITGTSGTSASGLIRLNGADYVTIDGIRDASGTSLSIENTSSTTGTAVIWLSSNGAGQGATNNTIKNVTLKGGIDQKAGSNTSYGVVIAGNTLNGTITSVTAGDDNDNNTIDTCYFIKLRYGVYTRGGSATNPNTGTMIKRNIVGPSSFGVDEIGKAGIVVREEDGVQILNNEVRYVGGDFNNNPGGAARAGIALATDATWTPTSVFVKNAKVMNNNIHDIMDEKTGAALGVLLAGADGTNATNNIVANNFIYSIKANGTTAPNQAVGIGISAGNGDKVVFNSVNLTGSVVPSGGATVPTVSNFGIRVSSTSASNLSLLNNIVVMDLSGGGALANYCIDLPTAYSFGTGDMNYNNWYANPANSQSRTGSYNNGAANQSANLAAWQSASSKDGNSKEIDPQFTSSTDLHLQSSSTLDGQGTPVVGVTTDIDNQARSATTPDIGADELPAASGFDIKPLALISPAVSAKGCYNTEVVSVSIQNNGSSTINFAGTPVTVNVAVSGAVTFAYPAKLINTGTLAPGATLNVTISSTGVNELDMSTPGIYMFDITTSVTGTTDVNTANDALQETRTKEVLTVGTTTATPAEFCKNGKPTLSSTGANGYSALQWKQSTVSGGPYSNVAGGNVPSLTVGTDITATTFYVLEATCGTTTDLSAESTVIVNNAQVTVTPGTRCGVGTVNLSATTTGTSVKWYAAATGGTALATGNNFTTPSISATTTYYVGGIAGSSTISAGLPSTGAYGTYGSPGGTGYGLYFTTNKGMILQTVAVYPVATGTCTIQLQDGTGALIPGQEVTVNFTATDVKTLVTLNFVIPSAGSYRLMNTAGVALNRYNPYSGPAYPISYDNGTIILTQGSVGTGTYYSFFDWKLLVECESDRVPVTATVTSPPALTGVTATPASICVGQSSNLNVTSGNANYTYSWAPIGQPGASQTVNPTSTTTYTVTATDAGTSCVTTGTATVTVNPVPSAITISPTTLTLCPNSAPGLLTANGGTLGGIFTLGSGSAAPTSANSITPYTSNWEGARAQYLIQASELTGMGMVAGNITGLSFNVTAAGSGAFAQSNFTIKMAATANASLNSAYGTPTGSFTTVYTVASEPAPPVGWKQYVFTTPFVWDGTSNILVDICHDNDPTGTCAGCYSANSTVAASTTSFNSVWGSYADNAQSCGVQAANLVTTFNIRPDIRFDAQTPTTITWASTTGLFTDAAGTTAYTGTSTATVYANPSANTTYTVTATTGANCTATQTVSVVRSSAITNATTLAGTTGGAQVCSGNLDVAVSNNYFNNCNIIATIAPSGGTAVSGNINACVKIDNTVQTAPNGQPFVQRHFDITPAANAATATSTITLYFTQAEFNAYNAARGTYPALPTGASDAAGIANLRVTQYNGTGTAPGNYTGTASLIDPSDASIVFDAAANGGAGMWSVTFSVTGSGGFYVHTGTYILPVTITAFNGENAGSVNKLFWNTSSESNSKGFELERSADGVNFTRIAFVATKANGGNSTTALSYSYDDRRPLVGANYYRLKQIDNDGKYAYSNIVLLNRKVTEIMITKVYPNPATAELNILITSPRSEKLTIVVTDLTGKIVMQHSMNVVLGDNQQQLQIGALAGGTYMIKAVCANGCETAVQRFVKH